MAVVVDSRNAGTSGEAVTSISWNHTIGSSLSNVTVFVPVAANDPGALSAPRPMTTIGQVVWDTDEQGMSREINGQILSSAGGGNLGAHGCDFWFLRGVQAGTKTIVVRRNPLTVPGTTTIIGASISCSGVDQSNSFLVDVNLSSTSRVSSGTNPSITVGSVVDGLCIDCVGLELTGGSPPTGVVGAGQTQIFQTVVPSNLNYGSGSDEAGTGSAVTMSWTGLNVAANNGGNTLPISIRPSTTTTDNSIRAFLYKRS